MTISIETNKVMTIKELPQYIYEIVNKYKLIQHYINSYDDNFYLHFDIKFIGNYGTFDQFFSIQVNKLKKMIFVLA